MFNVDYQTDIDWLQKISYKLPMFSKVGTGRGVFSCRCILCGDSKKSSKIKRLFFYTKSGSLNYECKNCGESGSFWNFVKDHSSIDFEEYKRDQIKTILISDNSEAFTKKTKPKHVENKPNQKYKGLVGCTPLLDLPSDHKALVYMKDRGLGIPQLERLLYSPSFKVTAKALSPDSINDDFPDSERIVIPFLYGDGVKAIQGRTIGGNSKMKYITIKADPDNDKIFGLEMVNENELVFCIEGPVDSLFIDNCIATCDANLTKADADVYIWDNQPRNRDVVKYMERAISAGKSLVIWPESSDTKSDINDLIIQGYTTDDIMNILKSNIYNGLKAKLMLSKWRKV